MTTENSQTPEHDATTTETMDRFPHRNLVRSLLEVIRQREEGEDEELAGRAEAYALLNDAWREHASDIHIDPYEDGVCIRLRIDGVVLNATTLDRHHGPRLVNQLKILSGINPVTLLTPEDGRFGFEIDGEDFDFRTTCMPCINGEKLAIRTLIPGRVQYKLHELGLQNKDMDNIDQWLNRVRGMLLVTGPTGSGKTTTLYALLHKLKIRDYNIMTVEDPVEYEITGVNQVQVNREHKLDFADGVRAMLRLDPDFMLLGEIRDRASLRAAFDAAVSGRALMATMHSHDAVSAITVMRNYGLNNLEISSNVETVIAQRLVRKLCSHCREKTQPRSEDKRWLRSMGIDPPPYAWYGKGCKHCRQVGYQGRTGIFEVWRIAQEDYPLLLDNADERTLRNQLARRGHQFLIDDALGKVMAGVTSLTEIRPIGGFGSLGPVIRDRAINPVPSTG